MGLGLFASLTIVSGIHGFLLQAFFSLLTFLLFLVIAFPVSRYLFKSRIESLIFSFPIGWAIHSLLLSLWGSVVGISTMSFLIYLGLILSTALILFKKQNGRFNVFGNETDANWSARDTLLLLIWGLATVLVISVPLIHVGTPTEHGYAYRAYFNTDFVRNMAVVGSLINTGIPPNNPYFSGITLHYYWLFHILLAFWRTVFRSYRPDFMLVQFTLVAVSIFASTLFVILRKHFVSRPALYWGLPIFLVGGSYKGWLVLYELRQKHLPWTAFTTMNIEGYIRWLWKAPQVDPLFRALLYAPQHLLALTLFLLVLLLFWSPESKGQRVLSYVFLFASIGFSLIIGAMVTLVFAALLIVQFVRNPRQKGWEVFAFGVIGLFFLFLYWQVFHMFYPEVSQLRFGLHPEIMHRLPSYLILNWGALIVLGTAGAIWHNKNALWRSLIFFLAISFSIIAFVTIDVNAASDISLKVGYVSHLVLLILSAGFFEWSLSRFSKRRALLAIVTVLLLFPAAISWMMDTYNSQDIHNPRFTTYIPPEKSEVFHWMRSNLPRDAVVQSFLTGKGYVNQFVSEVPPFAERGVYLGDRILSRIFQIQEEKVKQREQVVRRLFREESPAAVHRQAQSCRIDYLFVGNTSDDESLEFINELVDPPFRMVKQTGTTVLLQVTPRTESDPIQNKVLLAQQMHPILQATYSDNFYPPELHPQSSEPMRWIGNEGTVLLQAEKDLSGKLEFNASSLGHDRPIRIYLNKNLIHETVIQTKGTKVSFPLKLTPGISRLEIHSIDQPEEGSAYERNGDHRLLSLKIMRLRFVNPQTVL